MNLNKKPFPENYELDFKTAKKLKDWKVSLTYVLHLINIYRFRYMYR